MWNHVACLLSLLLLLTLLAGCGQSLPVSEVPQSAAPRAEQVSDMAPPEKDAESLSSASAVPQEILQTVASGTLVKKNSKAVIDYSIIKDGYVMVQYTAQTAKRLRVQVTGPATTYTFDLKQGQWTVFPLSDGNGSYQVTVYQNTSGTRYINQLSQSFQVELADEFPPFLRPNQYVDYSGAVNTLAKARELTEGITDSPEQVAAIYNYVAANIRYDYQKATTVKSGYLPVLETVLAEKKGICLDYAALMAGMLRSLGIPCKLVVDYADTAYHAWVSVWTGESGWVDSSFFAGSSWQRMDPTFAASGKQNSSVMAYIGDDKNYTEKYLY